MYQKIKNSLFYPRKLATSYKQKVLGFIIFLILLSSLPLVLNICINGIITYSDIRSIKQAFYENDIVEFKIEDNQLIPYALETPSEYIIVEENKLGIIFVNNFKEEEPIKVNEQIVFVFEKDGLSICFPFARKLSLPLSTYEELEDIDFSVAKSLDSYEFWNIIWSFIDNIITKYRLIIYPIFIVSILISMIFSVLSGIFMNTIILLIFERTVGVKFGDVFKNTAVAFFPYIIGVILAYTFGLAILTTVGNIIAFIYALIAHNEYRRIKMKENM